MKKVLFFLLLISVSVFSFAANRIALVIGNSNYSEIGKLENPRQDAIDVSKTLQEMGYKTSLILDAGEAKLRKEARSFSALSESSDLALVYYSGHGAQINGVNYILPTDLELPKSESDIELPSTLSLINKIFHLRSTSVHLSDANSSRLAPVKSKICK